MDGDGVGSGWGRVRGVSVAVNRELKFFVKIKKINWGGRVGRDGRGSGWGGGRGQGRYEQRSEVFVKIQKKNQGGVGSGVGLVGGGSVRM